MLDYNISCNVTTAYIVHRNHLSGMEVFRISGREELREHF